MYSSFYSRKTLLRVCSVMMFEINILNTIEQLNETLSLILSNKTYLFKVIDTMNFLYACLKVGF